ncbi:MAG TPA: ATP-dependent DNA helicase RecG [Candidatus Saccharimonadales bacterium]|nr:ATP-dependent DNA helicase RecG [Candidatus Saccharimonadales bacterium]
MMTVDSPLTELKGVGDAQAAKFAALGIKTVGNLVDYYPRRYEDYSELTLTNKLQPGAVTIEAVIKQVSGRYVRRGLHITEAVASDEKGSVRLVWFNQPYRAAALKTDQTYFISGQYELARQRFAIMNPNVELKSDFPLNTARIIPVYRETKGLTSRQIRQALKQVVPLIRLWEESLPAWLVKEQKLVSRAQALEAIHFPASSKILQAAQRRLGFEEVFGLSLASLLNKRENQQEEALVVPFKESLAKTFVGHLPFKLTNAQRKVIWQIYLDLQQPHPMNRLVEGDVGSGKTVVATMAALMALEQGWQVALMAPTELLARQHAETIVKLLQPLGLDSLVTLLVGSLKPKQKAAAHQAIANEQARFIIGTQALIQDKVDMHKLALAIIDEQHRFGVDQRTALQAKAGHMPHVLSLTATPIPRSLALTLYGELDISVLAEKPAGRQAVETELVSPGQRAKIFEQMRERLDAGQQAFVVCPVINESDALPVKSVKEVYEQLAAHELKGYKVGLLHGQLKAEEKQMVMEQFVSRQVDVLVATTVIEVGVDVPNATMLLIENPQRFGLAQLHQLRGRIGRGQEQGYCYALLDGAQAPSRRLRALASSSDGFRLAELDLELRGPGAIYGTLQHGQLDLRIAKLSDTALIAAAREAAKALLEHDENLLKYKELMQNVNRLRAVTTLN